MRIKEIKTANIFLRYGLARLTGVFKKPTEGPISEFGFKFETQDSLDGRALKENELELEVENLKEYESFLKDFGFKYKVSANHENDYHGWRYLKDIEKEAIEI